jgi:hypothetical protein
MTGQMSKWEKMRNDRERAFQKRMVGTPPKRNVVLAMINSAFFLWCLSAVFLTVGGSYVANHQACMREADQLLERRNLIGNELLGRQLAFSVKLEGAKTLKEIPPSPTNAGSSLPEFSKMTYWNVQQEWLKILQRIEYEDLPDSSIKELRRDWLDFNSQVADQLFDDVNKPIPNKPAKIDAALELKTRKLHAQLFSGYDSFLHDLDTYAYFFQPNCTPVCTESLNPTIMVMKSAKDGA